MTVVYSPSEAGGVGTSAEVTSFVGRTAELADVGRLLAAGRLVTVLGPGGVGKTRTARRAARQAADRYPDGVRIVDLSELTDPDLFPDTIAASLGLVRLEARQKMDAVLDYLSSRRLLLVLDTCEHVVEECALFAEAVLDQAGNVTILATSRQPLDVAGEYIYQLGPLPVPGPTPGGASAPVRLPDSLAGAGDAAELFAQRAAVADPRFTVTAANWPDLLRVCRRLDGIPLAIELAAVRLRALTMQELARRLEERYDSLATRRTGIPRHQTLRTAIEWSYDLCTDAERAVWERVSVFAGDFDLDAAREVCAGHGLRPGEIPSVLIGLVDKSVLMRDRGRYRMLDTIRDFGAGRLAESGQDAIYRGRHVAYFLETARSLAGDFLGHDQPERLRALRAEHGNLRAAIRHGLSSGSERLVRDGAELATALYGYWMVSGRAREGRHWLGLALEKLPPGPSSDRAWVLTIRSALGPVAGVTAQAVAEADEAAEMARKLGDDDRLLGRSLLARQFGLIYDGQLGEAFAAGAEAGRRLETANDRTGLLMLAAQTAHLQNLSGNLQAAVDACSKALAMLREGSEDGQIGEQWLQGIIFLNAGMARYFQGGSEDAARCCTQALSVNPEMYDIHNCAYALQGLGWLAADQGRWGRVAWLMGGADALWRQLGARLGNNPLLEKLHSKTLDRARRHVGEQRFEELFSEGARWPLGQLARYAAADADSLPGLVGSGPEPETD